MDAAATRPVTPRSVAFDELAALVGAELGASDWLLVDQPMIDAFAELCGDRQWIHVDRERARAAIGGTIAHGFLSLSLISALAQQVWRVADVGSALNYGFDRLRFTGTVPAGSRVRLRLALLAADSRREGTLVTTRATMEVEGVERPALVADWLVLYRR